MTKVKRTVVVTGGNRGIGFEVCRQLAGLGHRVVLTSRNLDNAMAAAEAVAAAGGDVIPRPLDVRNEIQAKDLLHYLERYHGGADVLINNAAIYPDQGRDVLELDLEIYRSTMESNLWGPLQLCQLFVPGMVARGYGRIVNVSSMAGQTQNMGRSTPAYRLSKLALNGLTQMLADSLRSSPVLVNSVCPGWVRTEMGGPGAPRSLEQGADTIVWLATLPDDGPRGGFFQDRQPIDW